MPHKHILLTGTLLLISQWAHANNGLNALGALFEALLVMAIGMGGLLVVGVGMLVWRRKRGLASNLVGAVNLLTCLLLLLLGRVFVPALLGALVFGVVGFALVAGQSKAQSTVRPSDHSISE